MLDVTSIFKSSKYDSNETAILSLNLGLTNGVEREQIRGMVRRFPTAVLQAKSASVGIARPSAALTQVRRVPMRSTAP